MLIVTLLVGEVKRLVPLTCSVPVGRATLPSRPMSSLLPGGLSGGIGRSGQEGSIVASPKSILVEFSLGRLRSCSGSPVSSESLRVLEAGSDMEMVILISALEGVPHWQSVTSAEITSGREVKLRGSEGTRRCDVEGNAAVVSLK